MGIVFKRTKILATIGPKTNSPEMIEKLQIVGVNGFRLNFSHGTDDERKSQIKWIRQASIKNGKPVAILQDLQGPKIRLGNLSHDIAVNSGDEILLDSNAKNDEYDGFVIPVQYNLAEKVKVGEKLYIFDGKIQTTVVKVVGETAIKVRVENAGILSSRKGINLPDTDFAGDILMPKDIKDIEFGVENDIDYVALSFVQTADDINKLRQILNSLNSTAKIIAKIETKSAISDENLESIIKASDGIMIARGDLAVEAGAEVVPVIQRKVIKLCRKYGRLSIVATQMMASMVFESQPTRAEVNDISNAVVQGADALMLSDETANGHHPLETVIAMKKAILYTQENEPVEIIPKTMLNNKRKQNAISGAAVSLANNLKVAAIITETKSGATAFNVAAYRPNLPIISVTSRLRSAQQLALSYANRVYLRPEGEEIGFEVAKELGEIGYFGELPVSVVIVSGRQSGVIGATDTIQVRTINKES